MTWNVGEERHPPEGWLKALWSYLRRHFIDDLSPFENQPLVQVSMSEGKVTLARLRSRSVLVLQSSTFGRLDDAVVDVLKKVGVVVIPALPQFLLAHPAVLAKYVHQPMASSIVQALANLADSRGVDAVVSDLKRQSPEAKRALRIFISKAGSELSRRETELFQRLPLLETLGGGSGPARFVHAREVRRAAPCDKLPVKIYQDLIDVRKEDCRCFAELSGVSVLSATQLLDQVVFPDVQKQRYTGVELDKLMKHVFDHFVEYKKEMPTFVEVLKTLPFVTKRDGERVKALDLFDPTEESLKILLSDEDVFPSGPLYTGRSALAILSELGLKNEQDLSASDVLRSVRHVEEMQADEAARKKAFSLLKYLSDHVQRLQETADDRPLCSWLKELAWIPTMKAKPSEYPASLPFRSLDGPQLCKPGKVIGPRFIDVVGSVQSVVASHDSDFPAIAKVFGWTHSPDPEYVLLHMRKVVECYTEQEKTAYEIAIRRIYRHLLTLDSGKQAEILSQLHEERWIWNGGGFSSHRSIVLQKPFTDLSPYINPLPPVVSEFSSVFLAGGVEEEEEESLLLRVLEMMKDKYDSGRRSDIAEVKRDLMLAILILNKLKPAPGKCLEQEVRDRLLIPTNVPNDSTLKLAPICACTYCDAEWLKRGRDASDVDGDEDLEILFVHRDVANNTSESLGVPSLMSRMLDADEFGVEECGQEEKLTSRIHHLLEGYTDGFAVPKELIQNADDAGATEVKFLYDQRTNGGFTSCLFDEGMKACQGPALWAYNDAVFTDHDFKNITDLGGATKKRDTAKIGRFGLGFNAVYNLTDVPSFVSRESFVVFDPHKTHLGKALRGSAPGIKINWTKNKQKLRKLANQFKPFNGIFGCDLRPEVEQTSYEGTLFRFPLRTEEQAVKSELKKLHYSDGEMRQLLNKLVEGAEILLLFTQTVSRVSIFHLPETSSGQPQPVKLFEVSKSICKVMRPISFSTFELPAAVKRLGPDEQRFARESCILRASSCALKTMDVTNQSPQVPESSLVVRVDVIYTDAGAPFFGQKQHSKESSHSQPWLVSSATGSTSALQYARAHGTLLPTGGVAVQLVSKNGSFVPKAITSGGRSKPGGKMFCYLPLPSESGVPVHVNGFFEVASDRRRLKEKTEDDKFSRGKKTWNEVLMQDAVPKAYMSSLEDLKALVSDQPFEMYDLWPLGGIVPPSCQALVRSFYNRLVAQPSLPSLFTDGKEWASIDRVKVLDPQLRRVKHIGEIALHVLRDYNPFKEVVVDLSPEVMKSFQECGYEGMLQQKTLTKERFYCEVFLPSIDRIPSAQRDPLVLHAIDHDNLRRLLRKFSCIPASPEGKALKCPENLVHPRGRAATLYSPEDGMFAYGNEKTFLKPRRLEKLTEELGMRKDDLCWQELLERAKSIHVLNQTDHERALRRAKAFVQFLNHKLSEDMRPSAELTEAFRSVPFLSILQKPAGFPLAWGGDAHEPRTLLAPKHVSLRTDEDLVMCVRPILDDSRGGCGRLLEETATFLGLHGRSVGRKFVFAQLSTVIDSKIDLRDTGSCDVVRKILCALYKRLQELHQNREQVVHFLKGKRFILVGSDLLHPEQVAFKSGDLSPYMYQLPDEWARKFPTLMEEAGVRKSFDVEDYRASLQSIKKKFEDRPLDSKSFQLAIQMARLIDSCSNGCELPVYLPDTSNRLCLSSELCMKESYWMPDDEGTRYVNSKISPELCHKLGVNTRRKKTVLDCSEGLPFGQSEELTNRIKRILTGYPCEKELLKELLQNADDAGATELCFISDPRKHQANRVFDDSWKPLQGPALCVFNNRPFTEEDIRGIQKLGEGNKGDDPNKTGQYGVGFNAVYHLTDAPSFLSKGGDIGEVLCVFDPHCKFVPGATSRSPGRRFTDINKLRRDFPDVFSCYPEELAPKDNVTIFRFPLRSETLAKESRVSETAVTVESLSEMMQKFKPETFEVLLFVNSVKKITLCEIDLNGKCAQSYEVTASLSDGDERKRSEFSSYMTQVGRQLRQKQIALSDVALREITYVVDLCDNQGRYEKWLVTQRIGFAAGDAIPPSLSKAFQTGDLTLLPRGGVATLVKASNPADRKMKAFCSLPLPIETRLPVHVNGHFALDHEARRNLWSDDDGGYRSDWNNTLLTKVIAPCYVKLLTDVRQDLHLPLGPHGISVLEKEVPRRLVCDYWALFPSLELDAYWATLSKGVYQCVAHDGVPLLPVQRCLHAHPQSVGRGGKNQWEFLWLSLSGEGQSKLFFNKLKENNSSALDPSKHVEPLSSILLSAGMNLVDSPSQIHKNFRKSGVEVEFASRRAVLTFFHDQSRQSHGRLQNLPQRVEDTPLRSVQSVQRVLTYCKVEKDFYSLLEGLPLLVTEDHVLRIFERCSPCFLTDYVDILPPCASEFMHRILVETVFQGPDAGTAKFFKVLDVEALAERLPCILSINRFYRGRRYVEWNPEDSNEPSQTWIARVWRFLSEAVLGATASRQAPNAAEVSKKLGPLKDWCLLPVIENVATNLRKCLAPLSMADTVVCYTSGASKANPFCLKADKALMKLGLPEIEGETIEESLSLAQLLVGSVEKPRRVLRSLDRKLNVSSLEGVLSKGECDALLTYFAWLLVPVGLSLEEENILTRLPFYRSVSDDLIKLSGKTAYILEDSVLATGLGSLLSGAGEVFLRHSHVLKNLHASLGCRLIGEVEFYHQFVLPNFGNLERNSQVAHLEHIRQLLQRCSTKEKDQLLIKLKMVPILPGESGYLQFVGDFYDPTEPVYRSMLPDSKFPPEPFSSEDWLAFLREIGLVQEVMQDQFVRYAKEVAADGPTGGSADTERKSKALIAHLFQRPDLARESLLQEIRRIAFVHPYRIPESLHRIQQQYGMGSDDTLPLICFDGAVPHHQKYIAWTNVNLLPDDADPCQIPAQDKETIIQKLGVRVEPTVEQVVCHFKEVLPKLSRLSENAGDSTQRIVEEIYKFLQSHSNHEAVLKLGEFPCVLVEGNKRGVLPHQIVIGLMDEQEIKPHLHKLPKALEEFQDLFATLGSTRTVSFDQCAAVLKAIHDEGPPDKVLEQTEKDDIFKAVRGLFESLEKAPDQGIATDSLFLPGATNDDPARVFLLKSTDLVHDNAPQFRGRVREFEEKLLVDLKECGVKAVNFEALVDKLPGPLKPRKLTSLVQECLGGQSSSSPLGGKAEALRRLLKSQHFSRAIVRLIRHEDYEAGKTTDCDILQDVEDRLNGIRIQGVDVLKTHLSYRGALIPHSDVQKTCFAEKTSADDGQVWTIYLDTSGSGRHEKTWISQVANIVNGITGGKLNSTLVYLPGLLTCVPREIWSYLDNLAIRRDETFDPGKVSLLVQPGDFVRVEDHHLLKNAFEDVTPGEVVGYEVGAQRLASTEETPVYIYAVVIEEVTSPSSQLKISSLTKTYKIDVGNEEDAVVADFVDLYKLRQAMSGSEDDSAPSALLDFQDETRKITELLQQAWTFPKKKRDKIIRRLYLAWHPSKNPRKGDCSKIFEFLQEKIRQFERERAGTAQGQSNDNCSSYFDNLDDCARKQLEQEDYRRQRHETQECEVHRPNPQPGEAVRWFRQAEADFQAIESDLTATAPSYEWVCFKCHQVRR